MQKQAILDKIKEYDSIIILRHVKPDGDCLGASLGLREILRNSFPEKKIYSVGKMKSSYLDFLGKEDDDVSQDIYKESLIIIVDTATKDRIDNDKVDLGKETIKIDHHLAVENYANINYVREDMPATCAIITDFYATFKDELVLSKEASKFLFVGVVTDTGRFRYRGVSGDVLNLASLLLDTGIDIEDIYTNLYIKTKEEMKLTAYIYKNFKVTENGVAYFLMSKRVQDKFGVSNESASSLVNVLEGIKDSLIWIFFIQNKEKIWRVRLRSRFVAINEVAANFNGGGHLQASGATVNNKKELRKLLKQADKLLGEFKKNNRGVY